MALSPTGKVLYSATFLVALPLALVGWAIATERIVHLPSVTSLPVGISISSLGASLLLWGMWDLWTYGGGLPMNANPPPRFVDRGAYRLLPHPIYTGFCMLSVGVSISVGSASGLWMISPMAILGCAALVLGYENHDLRERFGSRSLWAPRMDSAHAVVMDRVHCYLYVFVPWLSVFGIVHVLERSTSWTSILVLYGSGSHILHWDMILRFSAYVGLALIPLVQGTCSGLRRITSRSLLTLAFAFGMFLAFPIILAPSLIDSHRSLWIVCPMPGSDSGWCSFPSLPVIFAVLFAEALRQRWPRGGWFAYAWVAAVALSVLFAMQGALVTLMGALISYALALNAATLWRAIRALAEWIANSWREWRFGPVRVINHGAYVGAAGFLAIWISTVLAGPGHLAAILVAASAALVGAALWAQFVEGSSQLLRPYGFYGGLLGGTLGALAAPLFHTSIWLLLGVFSAAGSLVQASGRLRCLVQGCCHGRPAPEDVGIRYTHPNSRVCRLSHWKGLPLHPTPVYSILWNGAVTLLLFRLWSAHQSLHMITGLYFILSGMGRFVEESYRGEPQTAVRFGLRLYQWSAIASVLLGALISAFDNGEVAPAPCFQWNGVLPAAFFGLLVCCAMGLDFPNSTRRFSRLT
jgi:prolipoprotein diacylglyceryltransferase